MTTLPTEPTPADRPNADATVPVWSRDPGLAQMSEEERDYLFDLRGFDILENALSADELAEINAYVDRHDPATLKTGAWLGHVETHKYGGANDGINFQNIIEGGPVFERCITHPAWIDRVRRYIEVDSHVVAIDENFLNVRQSGGYIPVHSGGANVRLTSCFRSPTGKWMLGQINVLMALTDIGLGDGCTTVVPGAHKAHMRHPSDGEQGSAWSKQLSGADAAGMVQVHLKAGDALMFTDAMTHGSIPRTNPGERRVMIYRYSPHLMAKRFNYLPSEELLDRLSPEARRMVQHQPPRFHPDRVLRFTPDDGPNDMGPARD